MDVPSFLFSFSLYDLISYIEFPEFWSFLILSVSHPDNQRLKYSIFVIRQHVSKVTRIFGAVKCPFPPSYQRIMPASNYMSVPLSGITGLR